MNSRFRKTLFIAEANWLALALGTEESFTLWKRWKQHLESFLITCPSECVYILGHHRAGFKNTAE